MAGYSYYHISMRSQISGGQPFAPFVPSQFNRNDPPLGYVTKKKIVPVTSRPYHDRDDDDEDEWNHQRQSSPPRGHPSNVCGDNMGNKQSIGSTINKPDDGYNNGIGYGKKEGTKPSSVGAITNDNHNGYGYGGYGHEKPFGSAISPTGDSGNKHTGNTYYNNKPTPGWSATNLSKPTNDIDKAIGFLKDEAANRGYNGGHKPLESESDNNPHQRIYDGPGPLSSRPVQVDKKGMDLVNETERIKKINVPVIKENRPRSNFSDGRSSGYGVINHIEAEKRFKGMTI